MIGQASATQRIMSLEALESGRITHASQDGNKEFISLLACIGADGIALPPALIYKGDSGILQDTWVEDVNPNDAAFFAVSAKGWICDILGLNWLEQVFQLYTKQKAGNRRRLLIVDGHSSHVYLKFIDKCDNLRILLLILPSHSTHRLQPTYVIKGLCNTLQDEKKRRKRGKRLNLLGEEDSGPQFFSPRRVQAAREFQAAKEEEEAQRQLDISEKRRQATAKRLQKE